MMNFFYFNKSSLLQIKTTPNRRGFNTVYNLLLHSYWFNMPNIIRILLNSTIA